MSYGQDKGGNKVNEKGGRAKGELVQMWWRNKTNLT